MFSWPVFPDNGLANSVIPPVFVGLGFSTFFAETLGWNFSGLIVPGYLAPIFVVKPLSGCVIVVEAFVTYIILRILSDGFSRFGIWTRFFGQDAFFALFTISILVKSAFEGPLLPYIGEFLNVNLGLGIDYSNDLHSTGLIIVPLIANIFWRHGVRRNLFPAAAVIGLTFLVTRFLLIPFTNFSVSKFELLYSRMATDFVDSPRFYLILLVGTALASHNKYRYGWSYHGMLIPALLGIAWFTPLKILTTFVEAGIILLCGRFIIKQHFMKNITIEGPRKLFFLFTIGFALKMLIGFTLESAYPGFEANELYGFAYILPALLAMEMWPEGSYLKVTRVTVQTSLLAALMGTFFGLAFNGFVLQTDLDQFDIKPVRTAEMTSALVKEEGDFSAYLDSLLETNLAYGISHQPISVKTLKKLDHSVLVPLVDRLKADNPRQPDHHELQQALLKTGFKLIEFDDLNSSKELWLCVDAENRYHGVYIFRPGPAEPIVVEVPNPVTEINTLDAGLTLFDLLNARALFISGTSHRPGTVEFDVTHLQSPRSVFQLVHQVVHREFQSIAPITTLQIRGGAHISEIELDALMSIGKEIRDSSAIATPVQDVFNLFDDAGLKIGWFNGDRDDLRYSSRSNIQHAYIDSFRMGHFAALWLSREFRECLGTPEFNDYLVDQLGWKREALYLQDALSTVPERFKAFPEEPAYAIIDELSAYGRTGNIIHLDRLTSIAEEVGSVSIIRDSLTRRCVLKVDPGSHDDFAPCYFNFSFCSQQLNTVDDMDLFKGAIQKFTIGNSAGLTYQGGSS